MTRTQTFLYGVDQRTRTVSTNLTLTFGRTPFPGACVQNSWQKLTVFQCETKSEKLGLGEEEYIDKLLYEGE